MDTNPIESKLADFQLMPWSGQTVHFPAYSFQGQKDPLDAYCFDPNKEQLRLYRDIADPLAELRVGCQLINGYPVIISFDPPSTFLASYKATILSRASTSSITVPSPPGMVYMPFQLAGINFQRAKKNTLFADEMGLGKTIQIIGSFNDILDHQNESLLVICPAYLKLNWKKELERWLVRPMPIHIINAQTKSKPTKFPALPDGGVVIINYDILDRYIDDINRRRFNMVALDECHMIKTPEAKRTQAVFALKIPHRLAASGTPAVNRPIELWPIIRFLLGEKKAPPYWDFAKEYCGGKKTPFGLDVRGSSNPVKLRQWMRRTFMIRRLKSEVLKELPPKTRQVIELPAEGEIKMVVDMENSKFAPHEETIGKMMVKLAEAEISEDDDEFHAVSSELAREIKMAIHEISAERVRLSQLKAPLIAAHAKDCLLDPEKKLIIFTYHKEAGRMISDLLGSGKPVDGDMKISDRHAACERFQNDPECRVIVGTIGAMGVGVTLTASSHVIIAELDWRPGIMCQAEDRAHRIGQLGNVLVQYFLFPDSVDSKMIGNLIEKMEVLSQVLDQGGVNESSGAKAKRKKSPVMEFYASKVTPEVQKLVLRGLIELAAMDDRRTQDSKGFSKWDSPIGHRLASKGSLTRQEAAFGLRLIYRYRRQIPDIASALPLAELQK